MEGTIKIIVVKKDYGFIEGDDKQDYFLHLSDFLGHWNDLIEDYKIGTNKIRVKFATDDTPKGPRARLVSRLDWPNQVEGGAR